VDRLTHPPGKGIDRAQPLDFIRQEAAFTGSSVFPATAKTPRNGQRRKVRRTKTANPLAPATTPGAHPHVNGINEPLSKPLSKRDAPALHRLSPKLDHIYSHSTRSYCIESKRAAVKIPTAARLLL
jgi:hypothetical protein